MIKYSAYPMKIVNTDRGPKATFRDFPGVSASGCSEQKLKELAAEALYLTLESFEANDVPVPHPSEVVDDEELLYPKMRFVTMV